MKCVGAALLGVWGYAFGQQAGAWSAGSLSNDVVSTYNVSVALASNYDNTNIPILCTKSIDHVDQQVVSGMNYIFHVNGCVVDTVKAAKLYECTCSSTQKYAVTIFDQPWTNTHKILSIALDN